MKISAVVTFIAVIGGLFFIFALMTSEGNQNFPEANIDSSNWSTQYDYTARINDSVAPLQSSFEKIQDPDTGWFKAIALGITALPFALTLIPSILFQSFGYAGSLFTGFFSVFNLPKALLLVGIIVMFLWGVFKLVEIYQRWQL